MTAKFLVLSIVALIFTPATYASYKTELPEQYKKEAVYIQMGFGGPYIVRDENEYDAGMFYGNIKEFVKSSPESVELVDRGNIKQKVGISIGVGSIIAGFLAAQATGGISSLVGLGIYFWGILYAVDGVNEVNKGIWIHNGYVMKNQIQDRSN
ncbi:MAG: hypothetical protein OEZ43_14785 [Gammaproteobacteria bacterium]|nr:hypothetical protein [Gammaproteobacteria bacterium]